MRLLTGLLACLLIAAPASAGPVAIIATSAGYHASNAPDCTLEPPQSELFQVGLRGFVLPAVFNVLELACGPSLEVRNAALDTSIDAAYAVDSETATYAQDVVGLCLDTLCSYPFLVRYTVEPTDASATASNTFARAFVETTCDAMTGDPWCAPRDGW